MTKIYDANQSYPFEQLSLANPHGIQGGAFFSKLLLNEEHPCLFQTPKCFTKNGIVRTGKKTYCDLVILPTNDTFLNFLQEFEKRIQHLIYEKRNIWFHNEMEMENIEYFFNPVLRTYKKKYLIRAYVQQPKHIKNLKSIQIYDENENVLSLNDVTKENKIISIVEGLGIKFTSSSFHLELCLRQVMVLEDKPLFEKCLIQTARTPFITEHPIIPLIAKNTNEKSIDLTKKDNSEQSDVDTSDCKLNLEKSDTKEGTKEEAEETQELGGGNDIGATENSTLDNENIELDIGEKEEYISEEEGDVATDTEEEAEEEAEDKTEGKQEEVAAMAKKEKEPEKAAETPLQPIKEEGTLEKKNTLCEIKLELPPDENPIHLKKPIEVYREIYSHALQKARVARKQYIHAFLEAKKIKNAFLSSEIEDSDDDLDNFEEILE
jgi:hypothetical protein